MAKIIDITEKLNFEKPPVLLIQGREIHVNDDAVTMLSVMQLIGADEPSVKEIMKAYEQLFPAADRMIMEQELKLKFSALMTVIQEAVQLISGLGPDTPLGRVVQIRSEEDEEVLKYFTPEQKRIRREWRLRNAEEKSGEELAFVLESLKQAFIQMAGGVPD